MLRGSAKLCWTIIACASMAPERGAQALDPGKAITQYVHSVWTTEDGLPQNGPTAILQTADGYLWVGTHLGLARFDGHRFRVFDNSSAPEIGSSSITALAQDADGTLWIGTLGRGAVRLRDGRFSSVVVPELPDRVISIAVDASGSVWIGGYGGLAEIRDDVVVRHFNIDDGLAGDPVTSVLPEADGSLWIATLGGLNRLHEGRLERIQVGGGLGSPAMQIRDLYRSSEGELRLRSLDGSLLRRVDGRFVPWRLAGIPADAVVRALLDDRDGNLWVGTTNAGLYRIKGSSVAHYPTTADPSEYSVRALYEDRDGNVWAGVRGGGLHRFRDGSFTTFSRAEGLGSDLVFPVLQDRSGDVWVGGHNGLARIRGSEIRVFTGADGLPDNAIFALAENRVGNGLWVGTASGGLSRLRNERIEPYLSKSDGLPNNTVVAVLEDRRGHLWLGTAGGGLARYDGSQSTVYSSSSGLADDFVTVLHEDDAGVLWVGTDNGLNTIRDDRLSDDAAPLHISAPIRAIHRDAVGALWIGTEGQGLFRWLRGQLTHYTGSQGFPEETVYSILEDDEGRLWFNSYRGVFAIARDHLNAIAEGKLAAVQVLKFGQHDGMKSNEGSGGAQPPAWRARDGRLWFPTSRGVTVVDPARLRRSNRVPDVEIEALLADGQPVALSDAIRLGENTRRLEIRYTAPNLSVPERTQFRYRLEGFDSRWVVAGRQRVAHFTNLPPGEYRFLASASDENGRWDDRIAALSFYLAPHLYQTWWFRLVVVLMVLAALWNVYFLRVALLRAKNAELSERQRLASEIHDSLGQALSGIYYQIEAARRRLQRDPAAAEGHLGAASKLAAWSAEEARESVRELDAKTHTVTPTQLFEAISSSAELLTQGRVRRLQAQCLGSAWAAPPDVEKQLLRIAQEAVANAVEHGSAGEIEATVAYSRGAVTLTVRDDGIGFDPVSYQAQPGRGFGLGSMRRRAASAGGRMVLHSAPGAGTSVRITVAKQRWRRGLRRALNRVFTKRDRDESANQDQGVAD